MKATISNQSGDILEIANQVIYSAKVLAIGLFIPFLFVFGITYNTNKSGKRDEINVSKQHPVITENNSTVDFGKALSDQNS